MVLGLPRMELATQDSTWSLCKVVCDTIAADEPHWTASWHDMPYAISTRVKIPHHPPLASEVVFLASLQQDQSIIPIPPHCICSLTTLVRIIKVANRACRRDESMETLFKRALLFILVLRRVSKESDPHPYLWLYRKVAELFPEVSKTPITSMRSVSGLLGSVVNLMKLDLNRNMYNAEPACLIKEEKE
jgi:hypothetical protein